MATRNPIVRADADPDAGALDAYRGRTGAEPSRPEAVRRALADHLRAKGYLPAASEGTP